MGKIKKNIVGRIAGLVTVTGLLTGCSGERFEDNAKIFVHNGGIKILRTYEIGDHDHIFVESPKDSNKYITLDKYLDSKKLERYDRDIEKAKIKKLVGW